MTQTTWHASGATDAPPQVSGENTEASAAPAKTPLHPSTNPDLREAAAKIDRDRMAPTGGASAFEFMQELEELLREHPYTHLEELLRKHPYAHLYADARLSIPDYGAPGKSFSPEAPGPTAILELQTAVDAGPKRIELRASQEFVDTLDSLAQETNLSRANVIRRAIALYARALFEKNRGNVIGIAALENNQIKLNEIIQV